MRISISGAQGVGKTTLMKVLESGEFFKTHNLEPILEIVRSIKKDGFKINGNADHASQLLILENHYKNIIQYSRFITDRSAIDAYVYALWGFMKEKFTIEEHLIHKKIFEICLPYYTHVFYIPIEFPLVNDNFRDTNITFQKEIDKMFNTVFKLYHIRPIILTGSVEQRKLNFLNYF